MSTAAPLGELVRGYAQPSRSTLDSRVPPEFQKNLPLDTVAAASLAAGVRLEFTGSASTIELNFTVRSTDALFAPTMPQAFSTWIDEHHVGLTPIRVGDRSATVALPERDDGSTVTIYLPDSIGVGITRVSSATAPIEVAASGPRWLAYGDSITQGWSATDPGLTWTALAARQHGLDVANLGFAGAARGEHASAEHLGASAADVISLAWGTNSWSALPADAERINATMRLFLTTVRDGHPDTPIIIVSPIVRPNAEQVRNACGATLAGLRAAIESAVGAFRDQRQDASLHLIEGVDIVAPSMLVDGVHPGDEGHARMASIIGALINEKVTLAKGDVVRDNEDK